MNSDEFLKYIQEDVTNNLQKMFDEYLLNMLFGGAPDDASAKIFIQCLMDQGVRLDQVVKAVIAFSKKMGEQDK